MGISGTAGCDSVGADAGVSVGISTGSAMETAGVGGRVGADEIVAGGGVVMEGAQADNRKSPAVMSKMIFRMVEFYCFLR